MRRPMKNLQDKSKWTPKGPGGRLRRLQATDTTNQTLADYYNMTTEKEIVENSYYG